MIGRMKSPDKSNMYSIRKGKPLLAAVLSMFTVCGGQIYNDQSEKGWLLLFFMLSFSIFSFGWMFWLYAICDAYVCGIFWNKKLAYRMGMGPKPKNFIHPSY